MEVTGWPMRAEPSARKPTALCQVLQAMMRPLSTTTPVGMPFSVEKKSALTPPMTS